MRFAHFEEFRVKALRDDVLHMHCVSIPMALNSSNHNNFSTSNFIVSNEALVMKRTSQLGLSQGLTEWRKTSFVAKTNMWVNGRVNAIQNTNAQFSCLTPISLDGDTESIIRKSQMIRAQLMHATSLVSTSNEVVIETEEKKKESEMLQAQLLLPSTLLPKNEVVGGTYLESTLLGNVSRRPLTISPLVQNYLTPRFLNGLLHPKPNANDKGIMALCPSPLSVYFDYDRNSLQHVREPINEFENVRHKGKDKNHDSRIHSYPYKKNGPYRCSKCGSEFYTSQKFAAHVSWSHYKYETINERKKRLMAKVKRRNLRLQHVNNALTIAPNDVAATRNNNNNNDNDNNNNNNVFNLPPPRMKVGVKSEFGVEITSPSRMEKENVGGVKIKLEPIDI
ncbi:hypothetical protein Fmac_005898 [Flemingia macrophylla]|uniref:C2H2-type domain-containing protein n=1 Tax=Flemingia macrophylla TaxID=520843 RepID=A0ABD1NAI5_9FABA